MTTEAEVQVASQNFCAAVDHLTATPPKVVLKASLEIEIDPSFLEDVLDSEGRPIPGLVERLFLFYAGPGGGGASGLKASLTALEMVIGEGVA
ncbi:hypothetical protein J2129_002744 [Methanofollis sp. W23]|uniref:hypothetical protein n=1 Tax=Methanofollis sp. W23 TaxID=2817849 RepID=UPI001AE36F7A|nr:hypothetical protein [Methanofollis sp. W23]MBP2147231.1 hypothetical protein [Methanofollis sp. W23]